MRFLPDPGQKLRALHLLQPMAGAEGMLSQQPAFRHVGVRARSSWTRCRTETKALQFASPERVIAGAEQAEAVSSRRPGSRVEHRAGIG